MKHADLRWTSEDAKDAPHSTEFDDIYFAGDGPAETEHVFIRGNDLRERFAALSHNDMGNVFQVGELGFGSGLNFLMIWKAWDETAKPAGSRLVFFSVEHRPFHTEDMERAHRSWPDLAARALRLRALLPPAVRGYHSLPIAKDVTLLIYYGDAKDGLCGLEGAFDAWCLDGFSPAKNPDMWGADLFTLLAEVSKPTATAATFTVAGHVRRSLQHAGFTIEKRPGFGRKREMLTAKLKSPPPAQKRQPWFSRPQPLRNKTARIAIIGAGIAGASLTYSLKREGYQVELFDKTGPAAGASGNPGGLIMPRLDLGETPAAAFFCQSYLYTLNILQELQNKAGKFFNPCGIFQPAMNDDEKRRHEKLVSLKILPDEWVEKRNEGLFFPQAGVIDPARYVAALIDDTAVTRANISALSREKDGWALFSDDGQQFNFFDAVITANSVGIVRLYDTSHLALNAVAGQIDLFEDGPSPQYAIAAGPYAAPASLGGLIIGATYDKISVDSSPIPDRGATQSNIDAVRKLNPDLVENVDAEQSIPRTSIRCQTPDRLPIIGALPDWDFFLHYYVGLKKGLRTDYPQATYQKGLYVLSGLGSRGLVTAPLAAAMIAAEISGAPSPVAAKISAALHPARFYIRQLKRP